MNLSGIPTSALYSELARREGVDNFELYNSNENNTWIINKHESYGKLGENGIHCSEIVTSYKKDIAIIVLTNPHGEDNCRYK